jgi:hypothetical protein
VSGIQSARQRLADAVNALDPDVYRGYVRRPTSPRAGDAWPLWDGAERADGGAFMVSWRVRVFLPQDEIKASEWVDAHLDALYDAIEPVAYVDSFRPVLIAAAGGDQYALDIFVRSE